MRGGHIPHLCRLPPPPRFAPELVLNTDWVPFTTTFECNFYTLFNISQILLKILLKFAKTFLWNFKNNFYFLLISLLFSLFGVGGGGCPLCASFLNLLNTAYQSNSYTFDFRRLIETLRKSDRAVIYLFIAASYTPWLFLVPLPEDKLFTHFRWLIWLLAGTGVFFELVRIKTSTDREV